ncbi:MAG TPA: flagellin lysine-N-methylase, partial [Kofleriaceae bacterium]|nr:flagellin lysine-N-methylase [Kofleriaceae bacterium]
MAASRGDRVFAPRYLARFRCLAEACEDTCCQGWNVSVDEHTIALWEARLGEARAAAILDAGRPRLRMIDDGHCGQLGADRLCAIQRELGEEALPATCALFPRVVQEAGGRREATATLACPEVARLALLAGDAHDVVELPVTPVLALPAHTRIAPGDAARPWVAIGPALRDAVDRALADRAWPLATRLLAIARFADAVRGFGPASGEAEARRA